MEKYSIVVLNVKDLYEFIGEHYSEDDVNLAQGLILNEENNFLVYKDLISIDDAYYIMREIDGENGENSLQEILAENDSDDYDVKDEEDLYINGVEIYSYSYNEHEEAWYFYDEFGRVVVTIADDDPDRGWDELVILFGD